jgi:hypothetical protein
LLAIAIASLARPVSAESGDGLLGILDPGSRSELGLGGDPFLSPLDDDVGWWASGRRLGAAWMEVDVTASIPVTRAWTRGHGNLSSYEPSWTLARSQKFLGRGWLLWSELSSPRWDRAWQGGSNGFDLYGSTTRLQIGTRITDLLPGLTTQFTVPVWESEDETRGSRFNLGLRYDLMQRLRVQGTWGRCEHPELLRFDLEGEPWGVSMNLTSDDRRFNGRLLLPLGFDVEGSFARTDFGAKRARDVSPAYHFAPGGRFEGGDAALLWRQTRGYRFLYRWTRKSIDSYGKFSWGGQSFGNLNYVRGALESHLVGAQGRMGKQWRWLLDYERTQLRGESRGQIETWPFTTTLIDLLGPRYTGKAVLDARWTRVHSGLEAKWHDDMVGRLGVSWYQVVPDAHLDTWRPAFLVFGRADEKRTELSVAELQLAAVSVGWRLGFAGFDWDFAIRQFVPVHTERAAHSTPGEPSPSDEDTPSTSPSHGWKWPGGTLFEFTLMRGL